MFRVTKLSETASVPVRHNPGDAGYDLCANVSLVIKSQELAVVPTGIALEIPADCYARVAPRSGLALRNEIDVFAGVVDSSYRGEVKVLLKNHGPALEIHHGDRIAQLIFERIYTPYLEVVDSLEVSERGAGGFGSTGV